MIIWRGWGILIVLYAVVPFVVAAFLSDTLTSDGNITVPFSIGLLLAGAAAWFTGIALNRRLPQRKVATMAAARQTELTEYVESDTFSLGPGHPLPQTRDESRLMADALLEEEQGLWRGMLSDRHTFFFIPMQYCGILLGALAVLLLISSALRPNG